MDQRVYQQQWLAIPIKVFHRMKKLIGIIQIDLISEAYQLELDFKTERNNIKRYLKSLKEFKGRVKSTWQLFANLSKNSKALQEEQSKLKNKNSEFDYFILGGAKVLQPFNLEAKKLEAFYQAIFNQTADLITRLSKYLDQSKDSYSLVAKDHEKIVKDYAEQCFPETTTLLYMLGFVNPQKIKKVEDEVKEQGTLKETQLYINVLHTYLDQMEGLRKDTQKVFQQYYVEGAKTWVSCCQNIESEANAYTVDEDELQQYYIETGGAMTDRSQRSNKSNDNDERTMDI